MFAIIYLKTILHQWGLLLKDIQHDEDKRVARCIVVRAPKKVRTFDWLLNNCDKIWWLKHGDKIIASVKPAPDAV